ncbi:MAG TPA: hypothetical protein VI386_06845 [Candidatus Sulfotelmatobacter sp.]
MQNLTRTRRAVAGWLFAVFLFSLRLSAQMDGAAKEINEAAQEAEQRVSLSAEAITQILRNEPGLLLDVKKALVHKAYEQGRLLDPAELTDEALFQLLQQDNNIRVVATREIEDRRYILVKPTQRELGQDLERSRLYGGQRDMASVPDEHGDTAGQEGPYWSAEEQRTRDRQAAPRAPNKFDGYPTESSPEMKLDPKRWQNFAGNESLTPDSIQESPAVAETLQPLTPGELPEMLKASLRDDSQPPNGSSDMSGSGRGDLSNGSSDGRTAGRFSSGSPAPVPDSRSYDTRNSSFDRRIPPREKPIQSPSEGSEDRAAIRRQPNPYASVPSLYDLYAQVSRRTPAARRFGLKITSARSVFWTTIRKKPDRCSAACGSWGRLILCRR